MKGISRSVISALFSVGLLSFLALYAASHYNWSDASLKAQFLKHRADFEKLVAMAQEDVHLTRIAPDFTWLDDNVSWPRENVGVSEQRWNEYRRLFHRINAANGLYKSIDPPRIFFPVVSEGLVPTGRWKGIVFCSAPLSPVLKSLDVKAPDRLWDGSHVLVYRSIEGPWYIYYEEW